MITKGVFKRRKSTGSEDFSKLISLDATKFVLLSVFSLTDTIFPQKRQNRYQRMQVVHLTIMMIIIIIIIILIIIVYYFYTAIYTCRTVAVNITLPIDELRL